MIRTIAALFTCFNRKEKTIKALEHLYRAYETHKNTFDLVVYLTDDGSSDGTGEAVKATYPAVHVLKGTGDLYWAGGMRNSWREATKVGYDAYLLLNDDTFVHNNLFDELLRTHAYSLNKYGSEGIYIGSTEDSITKKLTYGGSVYTNKFLAKNTKVIPNSQNPQECDLGNANIMLVHNHVVNKMGILSSGFIHGMADFDYTMQAKKKGFPVMIAPSILGTCINDHTDPYELFYTLTLKERIRKLYNPVGLDFRSQLHYMKRHFPFRVPFVYLSGWLKVIFPKFYFHVLYKTR